MKKVTVLFLTSMFVLGLGVTNKAYGQSTTGTLSFSPTSVTVSTSGTTRVGMVYTGPDISGAEIHIDVPANINIVQFEAGDGLFEILNSPETQEVHIGKLPDPITSGETLAYMDIQGVTCGESGTFTFNQTDTLIPDVTMSFNNATYTIDCGSSSSSSSSSSSGGTVPTTSILPNAAIGDDPLMDMIYATVFISGGISIVYIFKNFVKKDPI